MIDFLDEAQPAIESCWRAIVMFGRNSASYKFALGKALLELAKKETTFVKLEDLAPIYAKQLSEHLKSNDKQGTATSSKFLDALRDYNQGKLSWDKALSATEQWGFVNVIDAFHVVNGEETPIRFFTDDRASRQGITITDQLLALPEGVQFENLLPEVEARWRLVETAWSMGIAPHLLRVKFDEEEELLFVQRAGGRRVDITSSRDALDGYQKGKCFYCFADISIQSGSPRLAHVDHFFPWSLNAAQPEYNLDGVWNLVLACQRCNSCKSAKIPQRRYLERLHRRNSFLIDSHHPLRETLINQTGDRPKDRVRFLKHMYSFAAGLLLARWKPEEEYDAAF